MSVGAGARSAFMGLLLFCLAACQQEKLTLSREEELALPGFSGTDPALVALSGPSSVEMGNIVDLFDEAVANALRRAMIDAFQEEEMPAALEGGNRASARLTGQALRFPLPGEEEALTIRWIVTLPGQSIPWYVDQHEPIPAERAPTPPHLADIARRAVKALLPALRPAAPVEKTMPPVALWPAEGAPGNGHSSLIRAMERVFRIHAQPLAAPDDYNALALLCEVAVTPAPAGQEAIALRWSLLAADGREIGWVGQKNTVPAGSLNGDWGATADIVASAAWPEIASLIERAPFSVRLRP